GAKPLGWPDQTLSPNHVARGSAAPAATARAGRTTAAGHFPPCGAAHRRDALSAPARPATGGPPRRPSAPRGFGNGTVRPLAAAPTGLGSLLLVPLMGCAAGMSRFAAPATDFRHVLPVPADRLAAP